LRILARDENLCNTVLFDADADTDDKIIKAAKESRLDRLIQATVEMSQVCISGSTHTMNLSTYGMKKTGSIAKYLNKEHE
jgi:hypothetical protein